MITLTCPRCQQRLTVSAAAPRALTCPNCLGPVENPGGPRVAALAALGPVPVIPLERQVQQDSRSIGFALLGLVAALGFGAWLSLAAGGSGGIVLAGVLAAASAVVLWTAIDQLRHPDAQAHSAALARGFTLFARGCGLVVLIVGGIVLLLFGACAMLIIGSNFS